MVWPLRKGRATPEGPAVPEPAVPEREPADEPAMGKDGQVWIEVGKVHVRNPTGHGRWPSLSVDASSGLEVLINGEPRTGQIVVQETDAIVIQGHSEEVAGRIDVSISEDELMAWVTVHAPMMVETAAADAAPQVVLHVAPHKQTVSRPHAFTLQDVLTALAEANVRVPPLEGSIEEALRSPGDRVLVARTRPEGRSPILWSIMEESGKVTGTPRRAYPFVTIGQPIVEIDARGPTTATGRPLVSSLDSRPTLVAGRGTMLVADGRTAIATVSGRPVVAVEGQRVTVSIAPAMRVEGSVTAETGDVITEGHLWIGRDVDEDRRVQAGGDVEIEGKVVGARIVAGADIRIGRGAAKSLLVAGGAGWTYAEILPTCDSLWESLRQVVKLRGDNLALVRRVTGLVRRVDTALADCDAIMDPEVQQLSKVMRDLARIFEGGGDEDTTTQRIAAVSHDVGEVLSTALGRMRDRLEHPGGCATPYLDNSRLEATGDVELGQPGAWRSDIVTLGMVRGTTTFRGGSIFAARGVHLATVGSDNGLVTRVEVGPGAVFEAGVVHAGTTVVCGDTSRSFTQQAQNVVLGRRR